jgi:hypothetical protein
MEHGATVPAARNSCLQTNDNLKIAGGERLVPDAGAALPASRASRGQRSALRELIMS